MTNSGPVGPSEPVDTDGPVDSDGLVDTKSGGECCRAGSAGHGCGGCEEIIGRLWRYLDGELDRLECERIISHFAGCGHCADLYRREAVLKELVSRACACEPAPTELRDWVNTRLESWRIEISSIGGFSLTTVSTEFAEPQRKYKPRS